MDTFLLADARKNINIWDISVLYGGDAGGVLVADADKDFQDDRPPKVCGQTVGPPTWMYSKKESIVFRNSKSRVVPPISYSPALSDPNELKTVKRDSLPIIYVKGTFYEIGFKIGRTFSGLIREYIENFPDISLYLKLYETCKGKQVYDSCYDAVSRTYPEYMRELGGLAAGADVPFFKLFMMHMEDIMLLALPPGEEKPMPSRGSTTVVVTEPNRQLMGHVVDADVSALTNMYVVKATITECCPPQEFTALCVGGMLPGNTIAFNSSGLVFAVDPVPIRKCNECGVPRSIVCRNLLSAHDCVRVGQILKCEGPGIGNGVSVICSQVGSQLPSRLFLNYEAAPRFPAHSRSCVSRHAVPLQTTSYFHLNKFHHLPAIQEIVHSAYSNWILSKKNILSKYDKYFGEKMLTILGENSIQSSDLMNIYTSTASCCGMVSVAVGLFDFLEETLCIYLDNPAETSPIIGGMPLVK